MKKLLLLLLVSAIGQAQNIVVKGNVFVRERNAGKMEKWGAANVAVSVGKDTAAVAHSDASGNFMFSVDKKFLRKNPNLSFTHKDVAAKTVTLTEFKTDTITLQVILKQTKGEYMVGKPAIYLYPQIAMPVSVKLDFKGQLGTTFPEYYKGWEVTANPNGELINKADKRSYNYLFWEGSYAFPPEHFDYKDGFVVRKENLVPFLIEKLTHIGLNNTEINDFIVFWLPQLQQNQFSFIHFWINDHIDGSSVLTINPKPDTEITVYFEFKRVGAQFKIAEQVLPSYQRTGFTAVEWGGCNLSGTKIE